MNISIPRFAVLLILILTSFWTNTHCQKIWNNDDNSIYKGDTVVLYSKDIRGEIQWQKSQDLKKWDNLLNSSIDTLMLIADSSTYLRAKVIEGSCDPFYSDTLWFDVYDTTSAGFLEDAFPNQTGELIDLVIDSMQIIVEKIDGEYIFQGDIVLTEDQVSEWSPLKGASISELIRRWSGSTIYYTIDEDLPLQDRVIEAIEHWEENTPLKFIKRKSEDNYVQFVPTIWDVCKSNIGMVEGPQKITLGKRCTTGNTIHEIGHTVGLIHEHSRSDRDSFITIHEENIKPFKDHNFEIVENSLNTKVFDYRSIMMYPQKAFSKNDEATITVNDGSIYWAQRDGLTLGDVEAVLNFYEIPNPDFKVEKTDVLVNAVIQFTDLSTNDPSEWFWNFGDGVTSTKQNPIYSYSKAGTYTVRLTAKNENGSHIIPKSVSIIVADPIVAEFAASDTSIFVGERFQFVDQSTNEPSEWLWNFGDGNTSIERNPSHIYSDPGKYTVSVTATNKFGSSKVSKSDYITVYNNSGALIDVDGHYYKTVVIGNQKWMAENLKTIHYPNGDEIPFVNNSADWIKLEENDTDDAYCYYDNDYYGYAGTYGALYTWAAAQDVCPTGWHLPSEDEWTDLETYIANDGHSGEVGLVLKATTGWGYGPGTDDYGFSGLPSGYRGNDMMLGGFYYIGYHGYWWSSSSLDETTPYSIRLGWDTDLGFAENNYPKSSGLSVRCVKNSSETIAPIPEFKVSKTEISAGETVQFTDQTINDPTEWSWNFGDGETSLEQNPSHTYSSVGIYDVTLTVTNEAGTNTLNKTNYVTVTESSSGATVTDFDGNVYQTVKIGNQTWMKENLKVTHYSDGTAIPIVEETTVWSLLGFSDKALCWYNNSTDSRDVYGALYTWAAAMNGGTSSDDNPSGVQGVCPTGWHLPSDSEWKELEMFLGMSQADADLSVAWRGTDEGGKLKIEGTTHWDSPNTGATDESGFSALPGGLRVRNDGSFRDMGLVGYFTTATLKIGTQQFLRLLNYDHAEVLRTVGIVYTGISVRCVMNSGGTGPETPVATFSASTIDITVGGAVQFTDQSTGTPTEWLWDFGDGGTSTDQSPSYTYISAGTYDVSLTVTNEAGTNTLNKTNYVTVSETSSGATVTDYDGNVYQTVRIGNQTWMSENLKVTHYENGTAIPLVEDSATWSSLGINDKALCWPENSLEYRDTYGGLYTMAAVMNGAGSSDANPSGVQGVCPTGWHLPSDSEWKQLEMFLGMSQADADLLTIYRGSDEGGKLKKEGTTHWNSPNTGATNESGFSALPGGNRARNDFWHLGYEGFFMTATERSESTQIVRNLSYDRATVNRSFSIHPGFGGSVRCVKNE